MNDFTCLFPPNQLLVEFNNACKGKVVGNEHTRIC